MGSHAAPSGGSASDDWNKPGRTRSKARSSTRADALADSALRQSVYAVYNTMPTPFGLLTYRPDLFTISVPG